jgi:hypothetical protein
MVATKNPALAPPPGPFMPSTYAAFTTIVSGLPRSGTSLMMQMLAAGGLPALTDEQRTPDADNPRGYYELEAVKTIQRDKAWLDGAAGKVVKMVHALLPHLPLDRAYRVIFMRRDLDEVVASQRKMLERQGRTGASLPDAQLKAVFSSQVSQTLRWLAERPDPLQVMEVEYGKLIADPAGAAARINTFLGGGLNEQAMAAAVDPSLHRNRSAK